MSFNIIIQNPIDLIYTAGAIQGVFVFILLYLRKTNQLANRILAYAILSISVGAIFYFYIKTGVYKNLPQFLFLIDPIPFLFGPLFYLYNKTLIHDKKLNKSVLFHFIPFLTYLLYEFPLYMLSGQEKLLIFSENLNSGLKLDQKIWAWLIDIQGLIYYALSIAKIVKYRKSLKDILSDTTKVSLNWLLILMSTLLTLWITSIIARLWFQELFLIIHTILLSTFYLIAYLTLNQAEIFNFNLQDNNKQVMENNETENKYSKNKISNELAIEIEKKVMHEIEIQKIFLMPDLKISDLAEKVSAHPHQVSQVLNDRLGKKFFDLINEKRVEELKALLKCPHRINDNILNIGLDCGFNSKSALNHVFKKYTGQSPSQYRSSNKN